MMIKNDSDFMCEFSILCGYHIEQCTFFPFEIEHSKELGYASYDGKKFTVHTAKNGKRIIDKIITNGGGFSHGGVFDNRGYFILSEVSIVMCPRFKTGGFKWLTSGEGK